MIIRAKTFEAWFKAHYSKSEMKDIAEYGCQVGVRGVTYYRDTVKLFERFKEDIFERLVDETEISGYSNIYEFMATFSTAMPMNYEQFANQLVWYMAESLARDLTEKGEEK